jgi:RND family efflux transporter MFP subunit
VNLIAIALRRPISVLVAIVAIVIGCAWAVMRMDVDVFPALDLPVIYVAQPYGGMDPAQMEGLLTNYYEYHFLYISGIHHVESKNIQGVALMKLFFHPGTNMAQAMAETINYVNRSRAFMPPTTVSPFVMRFDTGSVPVGYLVLSSETRTLAEIQDLALFRVRPMFATLPGVSAPPPFGGNQRTIVINVNPERLRAYHISPEEVIAVVSSGNTISPSGNINIGDKYPIVPLNSIVGNIDELGKIALKTGGGPVIYLRDLATIQDGSDIPCGYALINGRRAIYLLATKRADASTLNVVNEVKRALPKMQAVLPDDIHVAFEFDQSPYVTRSIRSLATEGVLGAALTGLMVLLFLRDWRSVLVVVLNIPLALMAAVIGLWLSGNTINLMTLGGLALAVGILVDEATVEVENIHTQFLHTPDIARAVRLGNAQTAIPRLLAMLCILAVFLPSLFMEGAARALFVPMSLAVGFSMLASYILSSTFVPVFSTLLLRHAHAQESKFIGRLRDGFRRALSKLVQGRWVLVPLYLAGCIAIVALVGLRLGTEIFPLVDAGEFRLRLRAPDGTRFEKTEQLTLQVLKVIQDKVGPENIEITLAYVGTIPSTYPINTVYQWMRGPEEAMVRVALKPGSGLQIEMLKEDLRKDLAARMPELRLSFEPADIINEVMSFGSNTPIDVAVSGPNMAENRAHAEKIRQEMLQIKSLRDLQFGQSLDYPTVNVQMDRQKAAISGMVPTEVARSLVAATSSSRFVVPNFWPDAKTGIGYQVQVQIPQAETKSKHDLEMIPLGQQNGKELLLQDVADLTEGTMPGQFDRYNMRRQISLSANIYGEDLGRVSSELSRAIKNAGELPKGANLDIRGQIPPMNQMFQGLAAGLALAVVAIFLLLSANFQSIRLALVTVSTAPAVVAGVCLALFITGSTLNIQSFIGAIMAIGVAMANGILLVTFAEHSRREGATSIDAALEGASTRVRPILMTSMAMIAGMMPLALAWEEGSEQSAPLGRAVIGGLLAATFATLFVLPSVFALVQRRASTKSASLDPDDPNSPNYAPVPTLLLIALAAGLVPGCSKPASTDPHAKAEATAPAVVRVTTVKPQRKTLKRTLTQPAQIDAFEIARLYAKIPAYVQAFHVDIGDEVTGPKYDQSGALVRAGQVLAGLSAPEVQEEFNEKKALVAQAGAEVEQAQAAIKVAEADAISSRARLKETLAAKDRSAAEYEKWASEYERVTQLVSRSAVTQKLADETRAHKLAADAARSEADARIESARSMVAACEAQVEKARADEIAVRARRDVAEAAQARAASLVDYLKIEAPFDGVVSERNVDTGFFAQAGGGSQAQPLFVVVRTDRVRVFVDVPEPDAPLVDVGDRAVIRVQSLAGTEFPGDVTRTAWTLDPGTRTLHTEIDVPNSDKQLRPGMYAQVTIELAEAPDALVIPASATLADNQGRATCFAVVDGKAARKPIQLGIRAGDEVQVLAGLEGDELLVVKPASTLDGQRVEWAAP